MAVLPLLVSLGLGALFGFGLSLAQMVNPAKVLNFLDLFGSWDPSLIFVMGGGLLVNLVAMQFVIPKRQRPVLGEIFHMPKLTAIDRPILLGSVIFGVGWGVAGYCPGPMITSLSFGGGDLLVVFASYVAGTLAMKWWLARSR